ncbi:hypothetical protein EDC40_10195 [Aminobacter aminovorans]|uniref:Lipoprotein n=2 Tax=Aminobacter aminovorans TaxID=83263 RepID=A0A380WNR2_AMIAI|nr:hypothetical protein EDC40_10195 [Aminobacter aminovorans]SUU90629.1 Uncharacterised protein [Aminobacter aminovorans]
MKITGMTDRISARGALLASLAVSGLALTGCMSAPTYGTDKSATTQLASDLTNIMSLKPKTNSIEYKPRPELVKPKTGQVAALPAPQDSIVTTASADWPESPEARRARIRDNATKNRDNPNFEPEVVNDMSALNGPDMSKWTPAQRKIEIERRLRENKQGSTTSRKYLSEPPLAYRQAAASAAQDELGEDEIKKERRKKKLAKKSTSWWPF